MKKTMSGRALALLWSVLLAMVLSIPVFAADEETLPLDTPDESGNLPFSVENMFPGDAETRDFTVRVDHKEALTLYYHADIRPGSEKLAEVLMLKVELPEKDALLYEGLMAEMPSALEHQLAAGEKEVLYRITASLDTSVGNDHQFQTLTADFRWWYEEDAPAPVAVKIAAEKVMDGQYPRGSDFTFVLMDAAGERLQTVKNKDGLIEFDTLHFDHAGTFVYHVAELPGTNANIEYDPSIYKVVISVTRGEDGLEATLSYERNGSPYFVLPRFVNKTRGAWPPTNPDNPKTGDENRLGLWLTLSAGSAIALLLLLLPRRKKEEEA